MKEPAQTPEQARGQRWMEEIRAAKDFLAPWHKQSKAILKRFKDQRGTEGKPGERRLNLFTAGVLTQEAILYGKTPQVTSSRRWKDSDDDVARVAALIQQRLLNDDVSDDDGYAEALSYVLKDERTVGMGQARVRYEVETEAYDAKAGSSGRTQDDGSGSGDGGGPPAGQPPNDQVGPGGPLVPPRPTMAEGGDYADPLVDGPAAERKTYECVKVDYLFWGDWLYSPCKRWEEKRWVAFKAEMGRKALKERFGDTARTHGTNLESVALDATPVSKDDGKKQGDPPWGRAVVWEVWDGEEKEVVWVTEDGKVLDVKADPLDLRGFYPCPKPLHTALVTTEEFVPRADFCIAEDLYKDIDELQTRIGLLVSALRVVGLYDGQNQSLQTLMEDTGENKMVPVQNWAMFAEKGGMAGAVQFFPVQEVAGAIVSLRGELEAKKAELYEVTGLSDILRGQGASQAVTATEQRIKANFGSARLQSVQERFARFATALQRLKAEVVAKHFEPETILRQSNILQTPDKDLAVQAVALLKDKHEQFRVEVQPEALAMSDFAALKEERMEVIGAIGQFISGVTPMVQAVPSIGPALLEILKWLVASLRGGASIEGVLDKAMSMAQQAANQPQQGQQQDTSKLQAEVVKGQAAIAKVNAEKDARIQEIQAETVAQEQQEANQMKFNVQEHLQKQVITNALKPPVAPPRGSGSGR